MMIYCGLSPQLHSGAGYLNSCPPRVQKITYPPHLWSPFIALVLVPDFRLFTLVYLFQGNIQFL